MLKYTYLLLNLGTIAAAIGMGLWKGHGWLQQWQRLAIAVMTVAVPFLAWDISAVWHGHWGFNPDFTLGPTVAGLPIEEILFFVAIPLVSIAIWELMPVRADMGKWYRPVLWACVAACAAMLAANIGREYSTLVSIIAAGTAGVWLATLQPIRHWLAFMGVMFGLFFIVNSILTALPIVEYGGAYYSGIRVGTIPLEDFFYNFALINLTILAWLFSGARHQGKHPQTG